MKESENQDDEVELWTFYPTSCFVSNAGGCPIRVAPRTFFKILDMAVSLISTNCWECFVSVASQFLLLFGTYLQLIQITIKLLQPFKQRHEIRRSLGVGDSAGLDYSLLVDQGFETQGKLGTQLMQQVIEAEACQEHTSDSFCR